MGGLRCPRPPARPSSHYVLAAVQALPSLKMEPKCGAATPPLPPSNPTARLRPAQASHLPRRATACSRSPTRPRCSPRADPVLPNQSDQRAPPGCASWGECRGHCRAQEPMVGRGSRIPARSRPAPAQFPLLCCCIVMTAVPQGAPLCPARGDHHNVSTQKARRLTRCPHLARAHALEALRPGPGFAHREGASSTSGRVWPVCPGSGPSPLEPTAVSTKLWGVFPASKAASRGYLVMEECAAAELAGRSVSSTGN